MRVCIDNRFFIFRFKVEQKCKTRVVAVKWQFC